MSVPCPVCGIWKCARCAWQRRRASLTFTGHDCYQCGCRTGTLTRTPHSRKHHHLQEPWVDIAPQPGQGQP